MGSAPNDRHRTYLTDPELPEGHEFPPDFYLTKRENLGFVLKYAQELGYIDGMVSSFDEIEGLKNRQAVMHLWQMFGDAKITRKKYANYWDDRQKDQSHAVSEDGLTPAQRAILDEKLESRPVLEAAHDWYQSMTPGLMLLGRSGMGKTIAAASLIYGRRRVLAPNKHARLEPESSLVAALMSDKGKSNQRDATHRFRGDVLIIDYCGSTGPFGAHGLKNGMEWIRRRLDAGKRTVLTYNGNRDTFATMYGEELTDSIWRMCRVVEAK
jgi:DNA replication protein DnaC